MLHLGFKNWFLKNVLFLKREVSENRNNKDIIILFYFIFESFPKPASYIHSMFLFLKQKRNVVNFHFLHSLINQTED